MSLSNVRIVLVEPSHPGNVGGAARALKTMALKQLVVVRPKRFPDPQAEWRAAGAQDVLAATRVCETLDEAIGDCVWIAGTSARSRRIPWPAGDVATVAGQVLAAAASGPVAVLFGRESSGLTNDELQRCHVHLQIPASDDYPSLNLAMAVQVVAYELWRQSAERMPVDSRSDRPLASAAEVEALLEHLERVLVASGFLDPANPGQTMTRLRRMVMRAEPDATEVQILRGVLTHLGRG